VAALECGETSSLFFLPSTAFFFHSPLLLARLKLAFLRAGIPEIYATICRHLVVIEVFLSTLTLFLLPPLFPQTFSPPFPRMSRITEPEFAAEARFFVHRMIGDFC